MKRGILLFVLVLFIMSLSSCVYQHYGIPSAIPGGEYKVVGQAQGKVAVYHLFGQIGLSKKDTVIAEINKELAKMAKSKGGDAVINVRYALRSEFYVVVTREVAFIEGDVIKYGK